METKEITNFSRIIGICKSIGIAVGDYDDEGMYKGISSKSTEPEMPRNLNNLPLGDLGDLLNIHSEWASYLDERLSEFKANLDSITERISNLTAVELIKDSDDKLTVKKAKARLSDDVQLLQQQRDIVKGVCTILESSIRKSNNRCSTISRNITARQHEFGRVERVDNHNRKPQGNFIPGNSKRVT